MRRQNQRMSRKDDQPSVARAAAFLQRKKRRLVATVLRFLRNKMKQNKQKRRSPPEGNAFFLTGALRGWRWFFWYFFAIKKVQKNNFLGVSRQKNF